MPLIYRSMTIDGEKPLVANSARGLGVRIGNGPADDIPVTMSGEVSPNTGGMSVAPEWRLLPPFRIPRRLQSLSPGAVGNNKDACWRLGEGPFQNSVVSDGLSLQVESPSHGLIEPSERCEQQRYIDALTSTHDNWNIDES